MTIDLTETTTSAIREALTRERKRLGGGTTGMVLNLIIVTDESGREHHYFPKRKTVLRQMLQIPFVMFAAVALGVIIVSVFGIEVLISESYEGPYKFYLVSRTEA